jgi:hypothetical protein
MYDTAKSITATCNDRISARHILDSLGRRWEPLAMMVFYTTVSKIEMEFKQDIPKHVQVSGRR